MPFLAAAVPFLGMGAKSVLGGRAKSREEQNQANERADAFRLASARFNREAPVVRAHQAVRGDLLANVQPAGSTGAGRDFRFTGGLSPELFSQGTRDLGASMNRNAVLSQLATEARPYRPGEIPDAATQARLLAESRRTGRPVRGNVTDLIRSPAALGSDPYTLAGATPQVKAGLLDKLLGTVALGSDLYGEYQKRQGGSDGFEPGTGGY